MDLKNKKIYVVLSKYACDDDIIKAYFHSSIYALIASHVLGFHCVSFFFKINEFTI